MKTELVVQRAVQSGGVPADDEFRSWAAAALAGRGDPGALTIRVVGGDESRRLNRDYRGKDAATNVLSFAAGVPEEVLTVLRAGGEAAPLGDLVICAEIVAHEAEAQNKPLRDHWAHLVVHGVLHLLGYDHGAAEDARVMEDRERELLAGLGIPDPYLAR